jgi:capsular polysaccharide biosynthesis protein
MSRNPRRASRTNTPVKPRVEGLSAESSGNTEITSTLEEQPPSDDAPPHIEEASQNQQDGALLRFRAPKVSRGLVAALLLLILPVILSGGVAFISTSRMEPVYGAESDILFDWGARADVLEKFLATQAVLARSQAVLSPVSVALGLPLETLEENLSIEFLRGSAVMRIQYADNDANRAMEVNKAIVESYSGLLNNISFINSARYTLVTARVLDEPVWPKPLQATAVGIAVGMAIGIAALTLVQALRTGL